MILPLVILGSLGISVDAMRHLFIGYPAGRDVWLAALWSVAIALLFAALAILRYRRVVGH